MAADPFASAPGTRPGERIVAARPHVFDLGALGDWLALDAARAAPDDLGALGDDALAGLYYRALRLAALSGHRDLDLARRITAERARRRAGPQIQASPTAVAPAARS